MSKSRFQEERELLSLQADLVRLKITLAKRRQQQQASQAPPLAALVDSAEKLGTQPWLWKTVLLPSKWRHKLLLGGGLLLWQWWRDTPPRR